MSVKNKVLNVFKSTEKPLRPSEIADQIGIESKEGEGATFTITLPINKRFKG